ncbi:MAG TPA: cold-shock protein [Rhizomicrobium sp.]|nr:cold-shock protein [Rhizomicrobium sp.]
MSMTIGTVKFFNSSKGFGFVTPEGGGKDVFVHASAVEAAGMSSLSEGQRISFETQPDAKGSKAVNLKAA